MANKQAAETPWQALEKQAYHAYREWPIWLVLRGRELEARLANARGQQAAAPQKSPAPPEGVARSTKPKDAP